MNKLSSVLLRITIDLISILGTWEESSFLMLGFACKELGFGLRVLFYLICFIMSSNNICTYMHMYLSRLTQVNYIDEMRQIRTLVFSTKQVRKFISWPSWMSDCNLAT